MSRSTHSDNSRLREMGTETSFATAEMLSRSRLVLCLVRKLLQIKDPEDLLERSRSV